MYAAIYILTYSKLFVKKYARNLQNKHFALNFYIGTIGMQLFRQYKTLKSYEIRHFVSFDGGDNLVFFAYSNQI